jgi:hypothetical protein
LAGLAALLAFVAAAVCGGFWIARRLWCGCAIGVNVAFYGARATVIAATASTA